MRRKTKVWGGDEEPAAPLTSRLEEEKSRSKKRRGGEGVTLPQRRVNEGGG